MRHSLLTQSYSASRSFRPTPTVIYSLFRRDGRRWIRISAASYSNFSIALRVFQGRLRLSQGGKLEVAIRPVEF